MNKTMYLEQIAQKIVDVIMDVIDNRNINIMDKYGNIVASGEKKRINTFHKGAQDVLDAGKIIEIYPEEVKNFPGAKEGVNMPISIEGKVIGVVGVHGHPDNVRMIAKLVKKSVELAIEQYLITEQVKLVKDLKKQLIRTLVYSNIKEKEEEILCLANTAGIELSKKRCAIVFKCNHENDTIKILKAYDKIEKVLNHSRLTNSNDFSGTLNNYYVLFKTHDLTMNNQQLLKELCLLLEKSCEFKFKMAMGSFHEGFDGYRKSFYEAKQLLLLDKDSPISLNDVSTQTEYLFSQINVEAVEHFIKPIYNSLLNEDNIIPEWIIETLDAVFDNNLSTYEAAESIYIHKNTLIYRVKKIEQMCGLSIWDFNHSILLKLLLAYIKRRKQNYNKD